MIGNVLLDFFVYVGVTAVVVIAAVTIIGIYIEKRAGSKDSKNKNSAGNVVFRVIIYIMAGIAALLALPLLFSWLGII